MVIVKHRKFLIREFLPSDAENLAKYFSNRQVLRNVRGVSGKYSLTDAKKFIATCIRGYRLKAKRLHFALEINGELVGSISISQHGRRAEIGYWLARPYWGQGIMTRVVKVWCQYIVGEYNLNELGGKVFTFNLASARVLQKNKFTFVTRVVNAVTIKGRSFDDYIFQKNISSVRK